VADESLKIRRRSVEGNQKSRGNVVTTSNHDGVRKKYGSYGYKF